MTLAHTYSELEAMPLDQDAAGELLTVQDAARFLNVTVSWIYEHVHDDAKDRLGISALPLRSSTA